MQQIIDKLTQLGWSVDDLLEHLDVVLARRERNRVKHKRYFEKNKQRLYEYHRQWRQKKKAE